MFDRCHLIRIKNNNETKQWNKLRPACSLIHKGKIIPAQHMDLGIYCIYKTSTRQTHGKLRNNAAMTALKHLKLTQNSFEIVLHFQL